MADVELEEPGRPLTGYRPVGAESACGRSAQSQISTAPYEAIAMVMPGEESEVAPFPGQQIILATVFVRAGAAAKKSKA